MAEVDPYTAPRAAPAADSDEPYQPKVFSLRGRIGRLRFAAYYFLASIVFGVLLTGAVLSGGLEADAANPGPFGYVMAAYAVFIACVVLLAVRRLNDLNQNGWLSLLLFVPLANVFFGLYLLLWPGARHRNRYGPPPARNGPGVVIAAIIGPLVFIVGTLAAVAIPAYQDYVQRAQQARMSSQ